MTAESRRSRYLTFVLGQPGKSAGGTRGIVSGAGHALAPLVGAVAASSMGMSEEVILGNLNPFAVALPLNLSYTANLWQVPALWNSRLRHTPSAGPACAACGAVNAADPVPLPPNPVMVMIPAAGANPGFAFIRIDPAVSGVAISNIPEPGNWRLAGGGYAPSLGSLAFPIHATSKLTHLIFLYPAAFKLN